MQGMRQLTKRLFIGWMVLSVGTVSAEEVPSVSLEEAVRLAETRAPAVRAADAGVDAAQAQLNQAWAARFPSVSVQANVLVYEDEQTFSLVQTDEPIDCTGIPDPFGSMCEGFGEETVVREQVTSSVTARAVLPITGQVAIDRQVAAAKAGRDAGRASRESTLVDARWRATDAWYAALQAERQLAIAEAQQRSLQARVETARAANAAGTLTRNDLLLAELSLARATQGVLQLEAGRDAAYGALGLATGTDGAPVRPGAAPEGPPVARSDVDTLTAGAVSGKPDLVALRKRVDAARASAAAASWNRLPSISAMGVYQHSEGQGLFAEADTVYGGATLDWTVWAWGRAAAGVRAANANAAQLAAQVEAAEAGARLEVRTRARALAAAVAGWEVARGSIGQAEENLAIQETRLRAGGGTMQEVLDAEVALLRARSDEATALYDAWRADAALERAVGGR